MGNTFDDFIEYYNKNLETTRRIIQESNSDVTFTIGDEAIADVTKISQIVMTDTLRQYHKWRLSLSNQKSHQHPRRRR